LSKIYILESPRRFALTTLPLKRH